MSAQISQQVLNRIAIGNYLLSAAGTLSPHADPLSVAQAVLLAHDASELVLAAIASSVGATFKDKQRTFLTNYVDAIEERTPARIRLFFNDLNEARVAFKHFGILPNAHQFHDCIPKTRKHLDEVCFVSLSMTLAEVGLEMLIEYGPARTLYEEAKLHNREGRYEDALKSLGRSFRQALDATPFAYEVEVGKPDTEAALHLLGCGVDPGMFLSLQKFLPAVDSNGTTWELRGTGHPGNWTRENVDYCLESALKIILQIQHVPFRAHATPFEYVFEDVLTAKADGVVIELHNLLDDVLGLSRGQPKRTAIGHLRKGQEISGHATFAYEFDPPGRWEETSMENANLVIFSTGEELFGRKIAPYERLLIPVDLVEHSHRVIDDQLVRERFPHLFRENNADVEM